MKILLTELPIANGMSVRRENAASKDADSMMTAARYVYCEPCSPPRSDTMCLRKSRRRSAIAIVRRTLSERERDRKAVVQLIALPFTGIEESDACRRKRIPVAVDINDQNPRILFV